jgi:retron-type reverse transcriptase
MKDIASAIPWSLSSINKLGDSDIFSVAPEFPVLAELGRHFLDLVSGEDLSHIRPGSSRRFIIPKDDVSYRTTSQLDPFDSIILSSLVRIYGNALEARRRPKSDHCVFSHRFSADEEGHLYEKSDSWNDFWDSCLAKSKSANFAVYADIADFYNQVYHHALENQLNEAGLPQKAVKWVIRLCGSLTGGISRGIPVGPHASHMLAESALCPLDNALVSEGISYCRYIDDIVLFVESRGDASSIILELGHILDSQQKLLLQRHKTKIFERTEFQEHCLQLKESKPINDLEKELVAIIRGHSSDSPYDTIKIEALSDDEIVKFEEEHIQQIVTDYLSSQEPDFIRLRWFIRRLAQVGHPGAVNVFLRNFDRMLPALSEICRYFLSVSKSPEQEWEVVGRDLLGLLNNNVVKRSEYYQLSIFSLFSTQRNLDNLPIILRSYTNSPPSIRREIILCAAKHGVVDWLRRLKEEFGSMDPWNRRALIYASKLFPNDEKRFFLRNISAINSLERAIIEWARE